MFIAEKAMREATDALTTIAAQWSGVPTSTSLADCLAVTARQALRNMGFELNRTTDGVLSVYSGDIRSDSDNVEDSKSKVVYDKMQLAAIANAVLVAAGSGFKHYESYTKDKIIDALSNAINQTPEGER